MVVRRTMRCRWHKAQRILFLYNSKNITLTLINNIHT